MFSSGAGVEVGGHGGKVLSLTALLPETFQGQTEGLFGLMNGRPEDDLTLPNGTALGVASSGPREHFAFGADCEYGPSWGGRKGGEPRGKDGQSWTLVPPRPPQGMQDSQKSLWTCYLQKEENSKPNKNKKNKSRRIMGCLEEKVKGCLGSPPNFSGR